MNEYTDLVLHIGLPRTGTTTLQEHFFSKINGYIGRSKKIFGKPWGRNEYTNKLLQCYNYTAKTTNFPKKELQNLFKNLKIIAQKKNYKNIIISDESLQQNLHYPSFPPFSMDINMLNNIVPDKTPFFSFLEYIVYYNLWTIGNIKVIISFRNQPEFLASTYARISENIPNACKKDFETKSITILNNFPWLISWNHWIKNLEDIIGKDMLCILFIEEIFKECYWMNLCNFLNIDYNYGTIDVSNEFENKYGIDKKTKKLLPLRQSIKKDLSIVEDEREEYLEINESFIEEIKKFYKDDNKKLATYLDKDLRLIGYY